MAGERTNGVKPSGREFRRVAELIADMPAGTRTVYHVGCLATERMSNSLLAGRASAYQEAAGQGAVLLSQRRLAAGRYEYLATKRGR